MPKKDTPFELGFSMPAEWETHESTWLSWPKNPLTFPPEVLPKVETAYVEIIEALSKGERVDLLVDDSKTEDRVHSLTSAKNLVFHRIASADVWTRDYGPTFVKGSGQRASVAATKWRFNAWGDKYEDLLPDNEAGENIAKATRRRVFHPGIVLEGGSIDVNGAGLLMTTEQCLLNENRNPHLGKRDLEKILHDYLGATGVVWLSSGVAGDDTDGHVDDIARFVDEDTVVCMREEERGDPNHAPLEKNLAILSGHGLEVVPIQMPRTVEADDGRLPASYANFYIGNSAVLLPVFGDPSRDTAALERLADLFPGRRVVPIDCRALVYGFGAIHCVTQQQPASG